MENDVHKQPFKTPDKYFENLEISIVENLKNSSKQNIFQLIYPKRIYKWTAVAVILLFLTTIFIQVKFTNKDLASTKNTSIVLTDNLDFTNEEILEYLEISDEIDNVFLLNNQ